MSATLAEIRSSIRGELSEDDRDFFTDAVLNDAINRGQDAIVSECPQAALDTFATTTVVGSRRYLLPEECVQPTEAWLQVGTAEAYRLDYIEPDLIDGRARWIRRSSRGEVSYRSTRAGMVVEIDPPPTTSGTLTVVSHIRPRTLSDDDDRTDIEGRFVHVLILYALARCKKKDEENAQADRYMSEFGVELMKLKAKEMVVQADQFNRTRLYRRVNRRWP